ncbi:phosphatase PAP2 family protein [Chloroflexota bacterium]
MKGFYAITYSVALALYGWLCFVASQAQYLPGDVGISEWFRGLDTPFVTDVMRVVTAAGDSISVVLIILLIIIPLWFYGQRLEAIFVAVLPAVTGIITWLLKVLIGRPRPGAEFMDNGGLSFPSGHVSNTVILFGLLFYIISRLINNPGLVKALRVVIVVHIALVAVSRVSLVEHWPSDVLGGIILGCLILVPGIAVYNRFKGRKEDAGTARS